MIKSKLSIQILLNWLGDAVLHKKLQGPETIQFVSSARNATQDSLVFAESRTHLLSALDANAGTVICPQFSDDFDGEALERKHSSNIIIVQDFSSKRASILNHFFNFRAHTSFDVSSNPPRIHPTARVHSSAVLLEGVQIGPNSVVCAGAVIEHFAVIGENCYIGSRVVIGHHCSIGDRVILQAGVVIGSDGFGYTPISAGSVRNIKIQQLGSVVVENDVEIGANSCIDRGTVDNTIIGAGTKIDNLVHIAHNCVFGKDCLVTAGFMTGGSSHFGDGFIAGGHCTIKDHVQIAPHVMLGGFSCVTGNITESGQYMGYPARPLKEAKKILAALSFLPEMRTKLLRLVRQT